MREKLIALLNNSFDKQYNKRGLLTAPHTADDLIANGVTIQKWIPVTERLPREDDANADKCVLAIHKVAKKQYYHWRTVVDNPFDFTHWMPLPEPPKEC